MSDGSAKRAARFPADLHCHTTCSDGTLSPTELVNIAAARGIESLAITDHDTVAGIAEAREAAAPHGLEIIPGIEISAWLDREVHLLGYFVDPEHPELAEVMDRQRENRIGRVHAICEKLDALGHPLDPAAVFAQVGEGNVGRPHVARALIQAGHARHFDEAFKRFLGAGAPAYVPAARLSIPAAIGLVHRAGGAAVIAHPGVEDLAEQLPFLAANGLDGVETQHPAHPRSTAKRYRYLARKLGLVRTGGSDFHTPMGKADLGTLGVDRPGLDALRRRAARYRDAAVA
ncbi:MAG: PHP domain-containing protein [Myxococcales bacterium]|nr:PHP domain-containing protein [Myxococcales bacterium]MCB9521875.1 PHP domain-containing protein [Myxococcales bacterium]